MIDPGALRLVAITDNLRDGIDGLTARARAAQRGGATMIQLRLPDESARTLAAAARSLMAALDVPLVVHCRLDVALAVGVAGVHLGVLDVGVGDVRRLAGERFIVGRSATNAADLRTAVAADYVTLGPVFPAGERHPAQVLGLSEFEQLARECELPVVAIGGVSAATAPEAVRAGARGVAVIGVVFGSRDPERSAREVRSAIGT